MQQSDVIRPIALFCPRLGALGGAMSHAWDMLRLWSRRGLQASVVAGRTLPDLWREQLRALGYPVIELADEPLSSVRGLPGAIVVGICDHEFLARAKELQALGCRRVWVNCMTWIFPQEGFLYRDSGLFEAYVFHGAFQRQQLERGLAGYGYRPELGHVIPGDFCVEDWPFEPQPHEPDGEFVVGRLARPDPGKWSRRTWEIYGRIDHPRRRSVVMGVDDTIRKWIGPAPPWAEVLPPGAIPARDYYRRLHCLMPINFSAQESWPRIGLEAMAAGVPIIASRSGGWCDMITHGENGFLAGSVEEFGELGTRLALDESQRLEIAGRARRKLTEELANPDQIWAGWERLFASLGGL